MLNPVSPEAKATYDTFIIAIVLGAIIFLLVTGLVIYIIFRYRYRPGQPDPRPHFGLPKLEVGWTLGPLLLVSVLFIITVDAMGKADPTPKPGPPAIDVIAHQWWWEVRYPQLGVITANEIHLPAGPPTLAQLDAADVIHSLWIPQLSRKLDMVPGEPNTLWLQATTIGVYPGYCAEYCGMQHAKMLVRAIAQPQSDFDAWAKAQAEPARAPTGALAIQGRQVFEQETCISCHAINGTSATARVGPDLTHVASRQTLASGVLANTPENLTAWLKDPQSIKPGSYMPNVQLTSDELTSLVAYLETLK